jgi:hypothetical protein
VLLTKDGYIQGYNAQAAVDGAAQIIVAHSLTQSMSDHDQFVLLIDAINDTLGRMLKEAQPTAATAAKRTLPPWPSAMSTLISQPHAPSTRPKSNEISQGR